MDMYTFETDEARDLIDLLVKNCERESGLGDLTFRFELKSGQERSGLIVERDGESSPEGVLLNDDLEPIRYAEMVWVGIGHSA